MRRPRIGLTLGITLLGLSACDNGGGPGVKTDGAAVSGGSSTSGTTSAGGTSGTTATTNVGGTTGVGSTTSAGGTTSAGTTTNAGGTIGSAGATGTTGSTGTAGTTDTTGSTGGTTDTAGTTGAAGTTSTAGGSIGGTTATTGSTGGTASGTSGGGASGGSRVTAGADAGTDGTGGLSDAGRDTSSARDGLSDTSLSPDAAPDRPADAIAGNCTCLGKPAPVCTPTGHLTYALARAASPTADQADAYNQITCAMDMAVAYYNCYANITGSVRVSYDTGVTTADGNINGSIRFGAGRQYMLCATAMHEIAHTQGIGTASQWAAHVSNGLFVGTNTAAQLQAINSTLVKPLDTAIHADSMHFWPYGLNYETEATGTDILIDHCEIVVAIRKDLGLQP